MQTQHEEAVGQVSHRQQKGSLHHCQDARGCERQSGQLDDRIYQALRAQAGLEFGEGEVDLQEVRVLHQRELQRPREGPWAQELLFFVLFLISFYFEIILDLQTMFCVFLRPNKYMSIPKPRRRKKGPKRKLKNQNKIMLLL